MPFRVKHLFDPRRADPLDASGIGEIGRVVELEVSPVVGKTFCTESLEKPC